MGAIYNPLISATMYHSYTLLLFTYDQLFDTIIPGTCFAIFSTLSGPALELPVQDPFVVLRRTPCVAIWLWLLTLQFCVHNQTAAGSKEEDAINKPWRPIPSQRITQAQARNLLAAALIMAGAVSAYFGVFHIFVVYTLLDTLANKFGGGGDRSGLVRNLFCAAGFSCYFSGALSIAIGRDQYISTKAYHWTFLLAVGILATTIQTQEFRDEEGDRARGRSTLVTVWGRKLALWTVIVTVPFWSLFAPMVFFSGHWTLAVLPVVLGGNLVITALKALSVESSVDDRRMYIFWCLWMCAFCPLPMMKTA
jgi:4-hydroxybenzoate polyprenyltransferase